MSTQHSPHQLVHHFEQDFFNTPGTYVHPTAIVGPHVQLGTNVKIGPYCTVVGNTTIGDNTRLSSYVSIGMQAQDRSTTENWGTVEIGSNCEIREFVSIHAPKNKDAATRVGNHCYIMSYCHVGHDVVLEDYVTLINNVNLAGHVYVEHHVMLMANTAVHQFCRIGKYSCLTPYSGTRQDLPPFSSFTGQPARFTGLHKIALKRNSIAPEHVLNLTTVTDLFYHQKILLPALMALGTQTDAPSWFSDPLVQDFLQFIANSTRGVSKRTCEYGQTLFYE